MECDTKMKRLLELKEQGKTETTEYKKLYVQVFYDGSKRRHLNTAGCK